MRATAPTQPGIRSFVAGGERVRQRTIRLGAVTDVCGVGTQFLGPGRRIVAALEGDWPSTMLFFTVAGMIGVPTLPVAAMWISVRLGRAPSSPAAKKWLLWTANLTWVSLVLLVAALTAHKMRFVGWTNRLLVVAYCLWVRPGRHSNPRRAHG